MRRRVCATWLVGAAAVAVCALWAVGPFRIPSAPNVRLIPPTEDAIAVDADVVPIDESAFLALLWNVPPTPATVEPAERDPATPEPAMRYQLIGITRDRGRLFAVLYDPEADRLLTVGDGDRIRHHTVTAISESEVELSNGRSTRRLTLREGRS